MFSKLLVLVVVLIALVRGMIMLPASYKERAMSYLKAKAISTKKSVMNFRPYTVSFKVID
jgi:hypothetical protein